MTPAVACDKPNVVGSLLAYRTQVRREHDEFLEPSYGRNDPQGVGPRSGRAARGSAEQQQRAALDEAELRDLERAEVYGDSLRHRDATPAASSRRSILDRLLRR